MKTICFIIALLSLSVSASAKGFSISIGNIRNDNGNILVMLQADGQNKPVYGMAKAQKGDHHNRRSDLGPLYHFCLSR